MGVTVSVAGRFANTYYRLQEISGDEPELLGNRLAGAAAVASGAAGAGISVFTGDLRLPIGASSDDAALAERLQFTTGEGPCLDVQDHGQSARVCEIGLVTRWPDYHHTLTSQTPFRAVLAVPITEQADPSGPAWGCVDLFYRSDLDLARSPRAAAEVISSLIGSLLSVSASNDGTAWLDSPVAVPRQATITAIGLVSAVRHLDAAGSLRIMRAHAHRDGSTVDAVAAQLMSQQLRATELVG